jgi:hypothetical protein
MKDREQRVERYRARLAEQALARSPRAGPLHPLVQQFVKYHAEEIVKIEEQRGTTESDFAELAQVAGLLLLHRMAQARFGLDASKRKVLMALMEAMLGLEFGA